MEALNIDKIEMESKVTIGEIAYKIVNKDRLFLKLKDIARFLGVDVATIYIFDDSKKNLFFGVAMV